MTPLEAQALLQAEMRSGSSVAQALAVLLPHAELECYRNTSKSSDPYLTAVFTGRGQGIHHFATLISPVRTSTAPLGQRGVPADRM